MSLPDSYSPYHTARGTIFLISKSMVVSISNILFFILMARFLPNVSDLGVFQGVQSLIALSVILAGSDLSRGAIRFISFYSGSGKEYESRKIYPSIFTLALVFATAYSTLLFGLSYFVANLFFHSSHEVFLVQLVSLDTFLFIVITYSVSLVYATQDFKKASKISIVNSIVKFGTAFILLLAGLGLPGIVTGFIIGDSLALIMLFRHLQPRFRVKSASLAELLPVFRYSLPLYFSSVLAHLSREMDTYLLLILSNLIVVGLYSPAVSLGYVLLLILTSLDQSIAPLFSRLYGRSGVGSLRLLSIFGSRYIFLLYLPLGFALFASTPVLVVSILGERYADAILPAMIIILALTITGMTPVFNNIITASGHSTLILKASSFALASQIAISILTIPFLGGVGAASSKAISYVVSFLYIVFRLKQLFGLHYDRDSLRIGLCGSVLIVLAIYVVNHLLSYFLFPIIHLLLSFITGFSTYVLFLRLTSSIRPSDIEILEKILGRKGRWLQTVIAKVVVK